MYLSGLLPQTLVALAGFTPSILDPLIFLLLNTCILFGFQIFWLGAYVMTLLQKRVMRTKFYIYIFTIGLLKNNSTTNQSI